MTAIPKTVDATTVLLEQYADLDGRIALVEEDRAKAIAQANQRADSAAAPMRKHQDEIAALVEAWWARAGAGIANGKKSVQLGGCVIGTKKSRDRLTHGFDSDDKAVEALLASRYARHTTRVKYSLDRTGTLKLLQVGGKTATTIAGLGFAIERGSDVFYVERVQQDRTIGA